MSGDKNLTWISGRAFRDESRERNPRHSLIAAERKHLVDLHFARSAQRQIEEDLSLALVVKAARILNRHKEG